MSKKPKAPDENDQLKAGTLPADPRDGCVPMPAPAKSKKKGPAKVIRGAFEHRRVTDDERRDAQVALERAVAAFELGNYVGGGLPEEERGGGPRWDMHALWRWIGRTAAQLDIAHLDLWHVVRNARTHVPTSIRDEHLKTGHASSEEVPLPPPPSEATDAAAWSRGVAAVREALEAWAGRPCGEQQNAQGADPAPLPAGPYVEREGRTYWRKPAGEGVQEVLLADFTARIVAEVREDDGQEERLRFEVEVQGRHFELTPAAFNAMSWPSEQVGTAAIVAPGREVKDRLRHAIQVMSGAVPRQRNFIHLGWTKLDDGWAYLHAGGAIGSAGAVPGVGVRLRDPHSRFELPVPPTGPELRAAVRASLQVLEVAPPRISFPLLAAVYRAPLGPCNFSEFLVGATGSKKSCLAALAQQHYGPRMDYDRGLPCGWSSTANTLEANAFLAKDALLVVDDFVPKGSAHDRAKLHAAADRLFRGQANGTGRQRMTAEGELRPAQSPRGLLLGTGEDVPAGASLVARMLVIEVGRGDVNLQALTTAQAAAGAGAFAGALAGYLRWLAPRREADAAAHAGAVAAERVRLQAQAAHARALAIGAELLVGLQTFAAFAREAGALTSTEAERLLVHGRAALSEALEGQATEQRQADPLKRFLEGLEGALGSGAAHVAWSDGTYPRETPRAWGWKTTSDGRQDDDGESWRDGEDRPRASTWMAQGERVGWLIDPDSPGAGLELMLDPTSCLRVAREALGEDLELTARTLGQMLHERGLLLSNDLATKRKTIKVRPPTELRNAGAPSGVLHVRANLVRPEGPHVGNFPTSVGSADDIPTDPTLFAEGSSVGTVGMSGSWRSDGGGDAAGGDPT